MAANLKVLVPAISAGLIAGIRTILGAAAMVTLIIPGSLPGGIAPALQVLLIGSAVLAAGVAALSTYPGSVAQVQDGPAVILGVMATTLAAATQGTAQPAELVLLILACANVAAVAAGLVFYGLGKFRLGALVRFIPYPVIGGFVAGSGLLILFGALRVIVGGEFNFMTMDGMMEPLRLARWLTGITFGVILLLVLRRFSHPLLVPGALFAGVLLYHLGLAAAGVTSAQAQAADLLLGPFPDSTGLSLPPWTRLSADGWMQLTAQIPTLGAIILVSVVALLLNASGLELATRSDLDINRELRAAGIANVLSGALGGAAGFHGLSASLLGARMGANSRLIGISAGLMCAVVLFAGSSLLGYMPKAILGGLLFTMGAGLLIEWLYDAWPKLPRQDYAILCVIVAVIGSVGILAGVVVGIGIAMAIFVLSYSRVRVIRQELTGAEYRSNVDRSPAARAALIARGDSIRIIMLEGFIFFGTAYSVLTQVQERLNNPASKLRYLVIDFRDVPASDSSAMSAFAKIQAHCERLECMLLFTRVNQAIEAQLRQAGVAADAQRVQFFADLDSALEYCEEGVLADDESSRVHNAHSIWDRIARALPAGALMTDFMTYLVPRTYEPGEFLLTQGAPPTEIIFIESGRVTVRLAFPDGRSIRLLSMTVGTMMGEVGVYLNQPRTASAVADLQTKAFILTTDKLREMERNHPAQANALHFTMVGLLSERLTNNTGLMQRLVN